MFGRARFDRLGDLSDCSAGPGSVLPFGAGPVIGGCSDE
jgi:hypothetical protein